MNGVRDNKALQLQPGLDSARDSLRDLGVKS